jgi:hypothetical protein
MGSSNWAKKRSLAEMTSNSFYERTVEKVFGKSEEAE